MPNTLRTTVKSKDIRSLVEAVGSWLHFELRCRRRSMFGERYMAYPIAQWLAARYGSMVSPEYPHPVLAPLRSGKGDKPRVDFAVVDRAQSLLLAIETKWIRPRTPLPDIIADLIRLELLARRTDAKCFFLVGGEKSHLRRLFQRKSFAAYPGDATSRPLMPYEHNNVRALRLRPASTYRKSLIDRSVGPFEGVSLPNVIVLRRTQPFPREVRGYEAVVYGLD